MPFLPNVIQQTHRGERPFDLYSRLFIDRIIFLGSEINDLIASIVIAQLLFLESSDPEKDIMMYINSPGGSVTAGLAIYDTMQYIRAPISTICVGQAASMAAVLLAAGAPGKRHSLSNSRIMIHQPHGGTQGQTTDLEIQIKEMLRMKHQLNEILAKHTKQPLQRIEKDVDRDYFMSAAEAKDYGIIDAVYVRRPTVADPKKS